jgi:pimeloyl-ACP methyl ester carboxylesterase
MRQNYVLYHLSNIEMEDRVYSPPDSRLLFAEGPRLMAESAALMALAPFLATVRRGDGHPVLFLPGFGGSDSSTAVLRSYVQSLGYDSRSWGLGRNLGPAMTGLPGQLSKMFENVYEDADRRKVSLVGWSLGGVYARLLAHFYPDKIRQVITLGSPFGGHPSSTRVYPLVRRLVEVPLAQHPVNNLRLLAGTRLEDVPNSNVFSKRDSIVPWQIATEQPGFETENIEVYAGHLSLGFSPSVLYAIAERLVLPDGGWKPFRRTGWKRAVYGPADLTDAVVTSLGREPVLEV